MAQTCCFRSSNLVGLQRGPGSCPRSHSKVITWNRSPALFPKAYCPSPEKHGEGRREKRNSQTENATLERKISRGQERKLSQGPGSKLRRRLPCGQVVRRKGSDYRAARLEERERKNKNRRGKKSLPALVSPNIPSITAGAAPALFDFDVQFETNQ